MKDAAHIAVLAWCTLAATTAGAAVKSDGSADPSEIFSAASEAFGRGDYEAAAAQFEAARAAGATGPAVEYNAGVSYYRAGDYQLAERAFRALADGYPEMRPLAEYNLGLALIRQNRVAEAREAFERAQRGGDPTIAALAREMLERSAPGDPVPQVDRAPWVKLLDVALGYDDNVALLEESSLPTGLSTDSPLLEVFGLISGRVGEAQSLRLDASAYLVRYSDAEEFDQDGVRLGVAYLWDWKDWRMDAGAHYDYSSLAGSGFERRLGASVNARYLLGESSSLSFRLVHDDVGELSPEFAFVDGTRDRVSVGFEQRHDRGRLALGYIRERNDRVGAGVSPNRHEVFAGYEHALTADWSVEVQGTLRTSSYDRLAEPRDEDLSQLSLSATRDFDSGWQLLGEYRVADNASNVEIFSYDRNRLILSLNKLF